MQNNNRQLFDYEEDEEHLEFEMFKKLTVITIGFATALLGFIPIHFFWGWIESSLSALSLGQSVTIGAAEIGWCFLLVSGWLFATSIGVGLICEGLKGYLRNRRQIKGSFLQLELLLAAIPAGSKPAA